MSLIDRSDVSGLLIKNESLFNHLYVINQEFEILPNRNHYGMSINYSDIKESRSMFIIELINGILDWVYSNAQQDNMLSDLSKEGRTIANQWNVISTRAHNKFRPSKDGKLLHGQFGELLLSNCIQNFFEAAPILRKMPIATSSKHERFGADAIHYKYDHGKNMIFLGEAKSYTSKYKFNQALDDSVVSILNTYAQIDDELGLYIYEGFLDPKLEGIAQAYVNGTLEKTEIHLVSIVSYNETNKIIGDTEEEIKASIEKIIQDRYKNFDNSKIDLKLNRILKRITYIIFPIWEFDSLINDFSAKINS